MNGKKYPREWEPVNAYTQRLHVPGGWLVNKSTTVIIGGKDVKASEAMEFVPDPHLDWVLQD